ncbi:MAG TPA: STAS domain-containing protein [Herpetosiphonaceae bacterium]|nr:STAS domain-containing protein [Herpetosiphonaceae bacterium]
MRSRLIRQSRGLRGRFALALAGMVGMFAVALGLALALETGLKRTTDAILDDEVRTSRLTSQVALATLLCRRYEKDLFLNLGDPAQVSAYRLLWEQAHADLLAAIAAFGVAQPDNQAQAASWQDVADQYGLQMQAILSDIESGAITAPAQANAALAPFKDPIRHLTDSAQAVAADAAASAEAAEAGLRERLVRTFWIIALVSGLALAGALALVLVLPSRLLHPIASLHATARRFGQGDLDARAPIEHDDEVGALAASFNAMADSLASRAQALEAQRQEAEAARALAEQGRLRLAEQLAIIQDQRSVLRELSVPLLPLSDGAMAMPLIGALDSARMLMAQERALAALEHQRIRCLLLDVTGVPVIDTQVASGLISLIQAARLLGAEVALVGIQPDVAQTLVQLGLTLEGVRVYRNMQQGIETILRARPAAGLR